MRLLSFFRHLLIELEQTFQAFFVIGERFLLIAAFHDEVEPIVCLTEVIRHLVGVVEFCQGLSGTVFTDQRTNNYLLNIE